MKPQSLVRLGIGDFIGYRSIDRWVVEHAAILSSEQRIGAEVSFRVTDTTYLGRLAWIDEDFIVVMHKREGCRPLVIAIQPLTGLWDFTSDVEGNPCIWSATLTEEEALQAVTTEFVRRRIVVPFARK